jgi:CO/xanthine dehydrogenase Mo-binding subunit
MVLSDFRTVGRPVGHVEGVAKVTGRARYAADIALPGMLWGACLRSPFPHARIVAIDTSAARALPGVHAVLTAADLPETRIGRRILDMPVLARERVRFVGEKVAAVAADSPEIAAEACLRIDVEYEPLPAVFDPIEAMQEGAPRVHDDPAAYPGAHLPIPPIPNVLSQVFYRHGDIAVGFAQADRVFEHSFVVPSVHQGYIEPHACVVAAGSPSPRPGSGRETAGAIDVWLSNKTPFAARSQLAAAIGVPEDRIRVHLVPIGGDFGGKGSLMDAVICYYLAARCRRPVKMAMTYTEELLAGNPRHAAIITLRSGVTHDGRMTARQAKVIFNSGAYGAFKPTPTVNLGGASHAGGPYRLPHLEIESLCVYTNTVPTGHMRAPGAPQVVFALESHVDMMAHALGLDPIEFRRRNALEDGDISPLGERWRDIACTATLDAAARAAGWETPKPAGTGRGVALYERRPGGGRSNAILTVDADARLTLRTAVPDTGTGSHTVLQQIVAEELQVPLDSVTVVTGDTDIAAFDAGAGGSRVTHAAGQATLAAATAVRRALVDLAARLLDCPPEEVALRDGAFTDAEGSRLDLAELMAKAAEIEEAPITRTGPPDVTSFCAQIAEVDVDRETGQVTLRRLITAHDVGTVINPLTHQGQIDGGVVQGIGQALTEQIHVEDGAVTNLNLGDYKLPTAADIPKLTTVLIETPRGPAPYQGKAIGELTNVAVPAAIANAVFDAVGVRLTTLPVTAERVYAALRAGEADI